MRITFVLPEASLAGGIRVVAIHAAKLQEMGHEVLLVSQPWPRLSMRERVSVRMREGRWPPVQTESHLDMGEIPHRVLEARRPVRDEDIPDGDVVIATWWETAEAVWGLSPSKGAKVYFIQGDETQLYSSDQGGERERVLATLALPMHRVTVSQWLSQWVQRQGGGKAPGVVPNAVDTRIFHAPPREKQAACTVGFVYSTLHLKGTDIAIAAIAEARRRVRELRIVAFGTEAASRLLPLPAETRYAVRPPQDEIPELYRSCDVWLFSSRREGFGLPMVEAMACRTPVIATPAGAAPELLDTGGGILLKEADAEEMAAAIERVAELRKEDWRRMSDLAHETVAGYTWEEASARFEAELQAARAQAGTPAASGMGAQL